MEIVAQYLRVQALAHSLETERDLFGRSAFNRFYYAAFLIVRADLGAAIPELPTQHAGIPDFLKTTVINKLAKGRERARRVQDTELVNLFSRARSAAHDLASLMTEGNSTRVLADYFPEESIVFAPDGEFHLRKISVSRAQSWPSKASHFAGTVVAAWRETHV